MWALGFGALTADTAVALVAGAAADDPLNAWVGAIHCFVLGMAGRYPEAVQVGERAVALDPDSFVAQWMLLQAVAGAGEEARALAMVPRLLSSSGRHTWALGTLAWLHGRRGRRDMARAVYDEMEARARFEHVGPFWLAAAASAAGLADPALDYARRAVAERDPMAVLLGHIPHWDALRADPRLAEVVRRVWG
jgi:predicted Zn-dependent protease